MNYIIKELIGEHNVLNASAAAAVCINLGVKTDIVKKALKNFSGVQRRMTKIFNKNPNWIYDSATALSAIEIMNSKKITSLLVAKKKDINKLKMKTTN